MGLAVNLFGMFAIGGHHHHVRRLIRHYVLWGYLPIGRATPIRIHIRTRTAARARYDTTGKALVLRLTATI